MERAPTANPAAHGAGGPPALRIAVEDAGVQDFAAVPTLRFTARVEAAGAAVRAIVLTAQVRVAATRRLYDAASQERLADLFGAPADWGRNLRSLLWTHATVQVPGFTGGTVVDIPIGCTYDFDVAVVKYFQALGEGEIPLEFLFSGTVFYAEGGALRAAQVPWDTEDSFRLPVEVWRQLMAHYFPGSAWLRLRSDTIDRLAAYKARNVLPTWEGTIEALLALGERQGGSQWTA